MCCLHTWTKWIHMCYKLFSLAESLSGPERSHPFLYAKQKNKQTTYNVVFSSFSRQLQTSSSFCRFTNYLSVFCILILTDYLGVDLTWKHQPFMNHDIISKTERRRWGKHTSFSLREVFSQRTFSCIFIKKHILLA